VYRALPRLLCPSLCALVCPTAGVVTFHRAKPLTPGGSRGSRAAAPKVPGGRHSSGVCCACSAFGARTRENANLSGPTNL
jgi:hypothetical protein